MLETSYVVHMEYTPDGAPLEKIVEKVIEAQLDYQCDVIMSFNEGVYENLVRLGKYDTDEELMEKVGTLIGKTGAKVVTDLDNAPLLEFGELDLDLPFWDKAE
jgi:hypothetical protein